MLDPNLLPTVRIIVAAIACIPVLMGIVVFVRLWLEARRTYGKRRYRY